MVRNRGIVLASVALASLAALSPAVAQERKTRIDVQHYTIDAEIDPRTQSLNATVQVKFVPLDNTSTVSFELNNALNVSRIVDGAGRQIPASRSQQDFSVRLNFPEPLKKGEPSTLTFSYDGKLTGNEESPVYGIKFAAIKNDSAFLLYPARWFPVNDYTADRYTAEMKIVVPAAYKVIASGMEEKPDRAAGDKIAYRFRFTQPSFPGSIAVIQGEAVRVSSQGVTTLLYFREQKDMANAYGEEIGKIMTYLTSVFGLPPQASLTVVETEAGTPNGYSAPGIVFLSPRAIGRQVNPRLLANQVARQWWGTLVSPTSRNHLWIQNGAARYSEFLYLEHANGVAALDAEVRDAYIEALTVDNVPLIQAARLEDYSPEYWAATSGKGAAVYHMLRAVMGDDKFGQLLKTITERYSWKSIGTEDFSKLASEVAGQNLQYFFIQWIESSGAPEFKLEYTVFRKQKGFRVMGKIAQDLDTFRMPWSCASRPKAIRRRSASRLWHLL
jgi:Aminopeptidase N